MKLNPDCIRDVMLTLEEKLQFSDTGAYLLFCPIGLQDLVSLMEEKGYSKQDTTYSAIQLSDSKYIVTRDGVRHPGLPTQVHLGDILYITPAGHEFIASIHDKETWARKISPILHIIGNVSLSVIESVSKGITNAALDRLIEDYQQMP